MAKRSAHIYCETLEHEADYTSRYDIEYLFPLQ